MGTGAPQRPLGGRPQGAAGLVTPPRGRRPVKPWVTAFLDCYSRLIMGWAVSLYPNAATVLAAMRRALVVDPDRGPFGGCRASWCPTAD